MPRPCDLCGGQDFRVWDTHNRIDVIICTACGMGRAEVPDNYETAMEERYDEAYYKSMTYNRRWRFRVGRARRWIGYLGEIRRPPGNLLDIGCSLGYYLHAARQLGWTAYGTDISPHAVEQTKSHGFEAFHSYHPDGFPDWLPPLDAVTAAQVVEHLQDPVGYLRALKQRMAPGGIIYVQLPNFQKLMNQGPAVPYVGPPEHAQFFTMDAARRTLEKAGWEVVGYPKLRPHYVGARLWRWIPELLFEYPREATREANTLNGKLSNLHVFARAV
jgi:2-polyprenyl-3-methyl-5-hydroxy-6-metoxy-1,4-benzoquinol methylase